MKSDFEKIKDIAAIGHKEPIPTENLYVSLKVSQKLKDTDIYIEKEGKIFEAKLTRRREQWRAKRETGIAAEKAVEDFDKLVVVGAPGSGKTTLLKYIALKTCKQNLERQERACVPVPIILRKLLASGKNLRDYIDDVFDKYEFPKAKKSSRMIFGREDADFCLMALMSWRQKKIRNELLTRFINLRKNIIRAKSLLHQE